MTLQLTDTIVDRVGRVKHSIEGTGDPQGVQVAVDGPCPTDGCDNRVVTTVHPDSSSVTCNACGATFEV